MDRTQSVLDRTGIEGSLEFFREIEFQDALLRENQEAPLLDSEQLDRLRLCTKLLANIQSNLQDLENGSLQVRYNQLEALVQFVQFIENAGEGDRLGYFRQPTGAGKTILMAVLAKLCSVKTLFLVPRNNLIGQTVEALKKVGFSDEDIGIVGGRKFKEGAAVTICTYQSLSKLMRKGVGGYELMLCDEAHRGLGDETNRHLSNVGGEETQEPEELSFGDVEKYVPKQAFRFGFTATPDLMNKSVVKYFKKLVHSVTFAELVKSKILVKFTLVHTEGNVYDDDMERGDISKANEARILEREKIYGKLISKYLETTEKLGRKLKTAVFCSSIAECDKFVAEAEKSGLKCAVVTSRESAKNQAALDEAEAAMMRGEIDFIVTVDKLGEGWDFPPLEAVILARATLSPVRIIQPIGRAARSYTNPEGVEKQASFVFETAWERKSARSEREEIRGEDVLNEDVVPDSEPQPERDETDEEAKIPGNKAKRKPLNVAQALVRLGEIDISAICQGIDGEDLQYETYQRAPEGWFFKNALADALNVDVTTIDSTVASLLVSNPERYELKIFLTHNSVPGVCYSPELVAAVKDAVRDKSVEAPTGWMSENEIQKELGISRNFVVSTIASFVKDNPHFTGKFSSKKRTILVAYYAPEVLDYVRKAVEARPKLAPPGWATRKMLANELGIKAEKIEKLTVSFRQSNSVYFGLYVDAGNKIHEYFSPELVAIVRSAVTRTAVLPDGTLPGVIETVRQIIENTVQPEEAPDGWLTLHQMTDQLNSTHETVKRIISRLASTIPAFQMKMYLNPKNKIAYEYYSPETVAAIKTVLESGPSTAPEGWVTQKDIEDKFKVSSDFVRKKLAEILLGFSDGAKEYRNKSGWKSEYYSPEVFAAFESHMKSRPEFAPEGWKTKAGLAVSLGITRFILEQYTEPLRAEHPEWFKLYIDERKRPFEHYSPELIALVREKIGK
jgi:superfamily II DNA or RNA helicase